MFRVPRTLEVFRFKAFKALSVTLLPVTATLPTFTVPAQLILPVPLILLVPAVSVKPPFFPSMAFSILISLYADRVSVLSLFQVTSALTMISPLSSNE